MNVDEPSLDPRNILDKYKGLPNELIKEDLLKNSLPFSVLMENWQGDLTIGTCLRNANAFGAREMFYLGKRHYDRRSSLGTQNYTSMKRLKTYDDLRALKEQYIFVGLETGIRAERMFNFSWPKEKPVLMLFGEEATGLTQEAIDLCSHIVEIPMRGSVRSINAGTASGIAMFDFSQKYARIDQ